MDFDDKQEDEPLKLKLLRADRRTPRDVKIKLILLPSPTEMSL